MPTRVIITGDRDWYCLALACKVVERLKARYGDDLTIVHGAAKGVDAAFDNACDEYGLTPERYAARWDEHGKAAGPLRNHQMVQSGADLCIAVHRWIRGSKGTRDCALRCLKAGIPVYLIDNEEGLTRRLKEEDL